MTIIHVVEPFATGINTFIHELVSGMPNDNHIIIHGERDDNRELASIIAEYNKDVTFIPWNHAQRELKLVKDFRCYLSLRKLLKAHSFDVVHLHSSKAGAIGSFWSFTTRKKNVVYTPNAVSFLRTDVSKIKIKLFKFIEKCIYRSGVNIVSCSQSEYDTYKKAGIETRIIKNGVTIDKHTSKSISKNESHFKIVVNGKITTQKNPELVNSIAEHFKNDPSISFYWIGDGELKNMLDTTYVNVLGWCTKEQVYQELETADLYLSASLWEGLPLSCIEAMSFKLPLLLSNCPGNVDVVEHELNGYIFETGQEAIAVINELKNNPEKRQKMSEQSQLMYEKFSHHKCAGEYRKLYSTMIAKK